MPFTGTKLGLTGLTGLPSRGRDVPRIAAHSLITGGRKHSINPGLSPPKLTHKLGSVLPFTALTKEKGIEQAENLEKIGQADTDTEEWCGTHSASASFALSPREYASTVKLWWPTAVSKEFLEYQAFTEVYSRIKQTAVPNYLEAKIPVPSELNIRQWRLLLRDFKDSQLVEFLEYGWPLDFTAQKPPIPTFKNHETNSEYFEHIRSFLRTELEHGAMLGPFPTRPFHPWMQISPLLTRPKKDSEKRRIVVNLSFPPGASVNDGITKGWYQGQRFDFTLPSITDLLRLVIQAGKGAFLWSVDLERAYRQLRVCPLSVPLLGLYFESSYFLDLAPPFGCRMSAMACARTTGAVAWLLQQQGYKVLVFLDDFIGLADKKNKAEEGYHAIKNLTNRVGLKLSVHKCVAPTTRITWLGYTVDTVTMTVTIPEQKVLEVIEECRSWVGRTSATRKELKSLFGKLNHLASCIPPAARFLSRILKAVRSTPPTGRHSLAVDIDKDLIWFIKCASSLNGIMLLPPPTLERWEIECDSSLTGGGAFSPEKFFKEEYSEEFVSNTQTIAHREALNLMHAFKYLAPQNPSRFIIVLNTDNQNTQAVLSSGTGRDSILTACARQLWLLAASLSCNVLIKYKPGSTLVLADALSRAHSSKALRDKAEKLCEQNKLKRIRITHSCDILDPEL